MSIPLTSSAEVFPAKTSASLASALASRVLEAAFGLSTSDSFASFDPTTWSLRTSQLSLLGDSTPSSVVLPKAGMTRSGSLYELPTLERPTAVNESSSSRGGSTWDRGEYPTPTATDYGSSQNGASSGHVCPTNGTPSLSTWARTGWATPTARDWKDGACAHADVPTNGLLGRQSARWPTAQDANASGSAAYSTEIGRHAGTTLTDAAVRQPMWATPRASDGEKGGPNARDGSGSPHLSNMAVNMNGPHHPMTPKRGQATSSNTLAELPLFGAVSTRDSSSP